MTAKASFGQWLRQRRKALDLTQDDLARRIGCTASTLYKIETDERRPSRQIAELLAKHLNIAPNERPAFVSFARSEAAEPDSDLGRPFHRPTNLTEQPTVLIGRDADVTALCKRLLQPGLRLLTLTGPPGIGKTRLAQQVARHVLDDFMNGVFFIALAPISDANLVATTIATTLGVPDSGPRTPLERLQTFLHDKQMLLVLDNFEQILAAAAQIAQLLSVCPSLKILVTSRAPLRIRQERQIPVSPLVVPDLGSMPTVGYALDYSAVTLFVERAQSVKPDFSLTVDNTPAVASICARLDGLPLAIELISARIKLLSPTALLDRLSGRLMLQSDGLRDIEPRHRTLNAAIEWSYDLLNPQEQTLFRRLGVFVGGWSINAAAAVCMENLSLTLLDGLASLLDKNLIKQDTLPDGEPRFMMLQTIREYVSERLTVDPEFDDLRSRHAEYFTALAEDIDPDQGRWLNKLEANIDNCRTALAYGENNLRLTVALTLFWAQRGHLTEGIVWLTGALRRQAVGQSAEALTIADRTLRAQALDSLGTFHAWQGNLDAAQPYHEQSVALFRELGNQTKLAEVLSNYGILFVMRGDLGPAAPILEESLALSRAVMIVELIAQCLLFLGILAFSQGQFQRADTVWVESLALRRADGKTWNIAIVLAFLAMARLEQGDYGQANSQLIESLTLLQQLGERWQTAHTLEVFAGLAMMQTQPNLVRAARIFGAAEVFRETLSAPVLLFQRHFNERSIASLRSQLDDASFATAWAEGRAMTLEQVVAYALAAN